jgi:hypothetical protein
MTPLGEMIASLKELVRQLDERVSNLESAIRCIGTEAGGAIHTSDAKHMMQGLERILDVAHKTGVVFFEPGEPK